MLKANPQRASLGSILTGFPASSRLLAAEPDSWAGSQANPG